MNATALCLSLMNRGVSFDLRDDEHVTVRPADICTVDELASLRRHKPDLIELLRKYEKHWSDIEDWAGMIGAGVARGWSMVGAYEECIGGPDVLLGRWRHMFAKCQSTTALGDRVLEVADRLLSETDWPATGAMLGWSERELWGISPSAMHRNPSATSGYDRVDALGLFTAVALSSFNLNIEHMDADSATFVVTESDSRLSHPRRRWCSASVPSWEASGLTPANKKGNRE